MTVDDYLAEQPEPQRSTLAHTDQPPPADLVGRLVELRLEQISS